MMYRTTFSLLQGCAGALGQGNYRLARQLLGAAEAREDCADDANLRRQAVKLRVRCDAGPPDEQPMLV